MHCTAPTSSARGERGEAGGVPSLCWVTTPSVSLLRRIRHQSLRWCQDIPSGSPLPRYLAQVVEAREASSTNREDGIGDIQQRAPINASRPLSDIRQGLMFLTPRTRHQISVRLEVHVAPMRIAYQGGLFLAPSEPASKYSTKKAGRSSAVRPARATPVRCISRRLFGSPRVGTVVVVGQMKTPFSPTKTL